MSIEEMRCVFIDQYCDLQQIKAANKEENKILDYQIKRMAAKLEALGVNVENLTL